MKQTPTPQPKIIGLSLWLYRCLLRLGPRAFRREYGVLALQDFRQCCRAAYQQQGSLGVLGLWPRLLGETIVGLLAEYWTEFTGGRRPLMLPTMRRSLVATFGAFLLFLCAYSAFGKTADPIAPFDALGRAHPELAFTYMLTIYSGEIALLALVLGGLPVLFLALQQAWPGGIPALLRLFVLKPKHLFRSLGVALAIALCFLGYLLATAYLFSSPHACITTNGCIFAQPLGLIILSFIALIGGITLGVFVLLVISVSLSLAVLRSEFGTRILRFSLVPISILVLAMTTATLALSVWTLRLWVDAPQFAASSSGLGDGQTAWVIAMIVAMAISTIIAASALTSGLRASQIRRG